MRRLLRFGPGAQGVAALLCAAVGTFLVAGLGAALLVVSAFLLLGAWSSRDTEDVGGGE